jgi:hypothetical protein
MNTLFLVMGNHTRLSLEMETVDINGGISLLLQ